MDELIDRIEDDVFKVRRRVWNAGADREKMAVLAMIEEGLSKLRSA